MPSLLQDFRYAWRTFRSARSALLVSALVLAAAIGAVATTYSVVSGVLLRSLPYAEPDRLVSVGVAPLEMRARCAAPGATMSRRSVAPALAPVGALSGAAYFYRGEPVLTGLGEPPVSASAAARPLPPPLVGARADAIGQGGTQSVGELVGGSCSRSHASSRSIAALSGAR